MRTAFLIALSATLGRAAEIRLVPATSVAAPLSAPFAAALGAPASLSAAPAAALPGGPVLLAPPASAAAAAHDASAPGAAAAAALDAAAPEPAAPEPVAAEAPPAPVAAADMRAAPADADESPKDLVLRLLRLPLEKSDTASLAFDGAARFPDAADVGAEQDTRHGAFTLATSRLERRGENTVLLERWDGPNGGLWLARTRGPEAYEIKEWVGPHAPAPFGGPPLPHSAAAEFWLEDGVIGSNVETANRPYRPSTFINAKKEFAAAVDWFGGAATVIKGSWVYGDNLSEFNRLTAAGASPEAAAAQTWTGQRAASAGFTRVVFPPEGRAELAARAPGAYPKMSVLFLPPQNAEGSEPARETIRTMARALRWTFAFSATKEDYAARLEARLRLLQRKKGVPLELAPGTGLIEIQHLPGIPHELTHEVYKTVAALAESARDARALKASVRRLTVGMTAAAREPTDAEALLALRRALAEAKRAREPG